MKYRSNQPLESFWVMSFVISLIIVGLVMFSANQYNPFLSIFLAVIIATGTTFIEMTTRRRISKALEEETKK